MSYKTCISIAEKTPKKLASTVSKALKKSEYVEIRFDFLRPDQVPIALNLVSKKMKNCVATLRPKSEGGKFSGKEKERVSILKLISEYKPFLLDVEFNTIRKNKELHNYIKKTKSPILVSWHDFKKTPTTNTLIKMQKQMKKFSNYIKIVTTAKSIKDSSNVLSLYSKADKTKLIAFAMGNDGRMSRILCLSLGSPFTYVSLGKPIAPGQFNVDEIKDILSANKKSKVKNISIVN